MKSIAAAARVKVSADGRGVVSHAGMGMLRELADLTGLSAQVTAALADTYQGPWVYAPGEVFADLAAAVADGADCIDGVGQLCGDREHAFGAKASTTTMWRLVDQRIDAITSAASARCPRSSQSGGVGRRGRPRAAGGWLHIDIDATLIIDHSDNKQNAAPTWKKTFGHHPLLAFLDRPEIAGGEALAGLLRPVMRAPTPPPTTSPCWSRRWHRCRAGWRPGSAIPLRRRCWCAATPPGPPTLSPTPAAAHRVGFSFGHPVDARVQDAVDTLNLGHGLVPGDRHRRRDPRRGVGCRGHRPPVDLSAWPAGTRLILRKERPHPGAQLRFTDADGMRVTAFITDTAPGVDRWPARRPGAAAPSTRPRRGPHPRSQGHRTGQPARATTSTPTPPGSKSSWPQPISSPGPSSSDSPATPRSPAARSPPSATGCCTSPPASPAAPANYGYASTPPGGGPQRSRPPGRHPHRLPLAADHLTQRPRKTHWPWESPPNPATRDDLNMSHPEKTYHTGQSAAKPQPTPTGMQNRG